MHSSSRYVATAILCLGVLAAGTFVFATSHTTKQPVKKGATPKCVNDSEYIIKVPTKAGEVVEPKGSTNKPKPPNKTDQPGCWVTMCVPAAYATNQNAKKDVCTLKKRFNGDEDLKEAKVDTPAGAMDAFQKNILADLARLAKTDPEGFGNLSADLRGLPDSFRNSINNAFKEQVSGEITAQQNAVNDAEQRLRNMQVCLSDGPECAVAQEAIREAERKLKLEKEALDNLNKSKVALEDTNRNPPVAPPPNPQACPPGQVRVGGECKANDSTFPPSGPGGSGPGGSNPSPTGGSNPFNSILSQLARALMGQQQQPQAPTCPTDPQQYQQYQQMYQQQLQQYNYQLQQYNYQQQFAQYSGGQSFNSFSQQPPMPPVQCKPATTGGGQCTNEPAQPQSACASGWQPVRNAQQCITSWQCGLGAGTAQISCQPQLADVGMQVGITFACSSGTAVGQGFSTNGQNSGSAQATTTSPGAGIQAINYGLTCTNQGVSESKQCTVTLNKPSLIFVANPKEINSGERSAIGWVTAGIESCIISSPELSSFTSEHASSPKKSGTVQTPALAADATFVLKCTTLAGGTRTATTTVDVR